MQPKEKKGPQVRIGNAIAEVVLRDGKTILHVQRQSDGKISIPITESFASLVKAEKKKDDKLSLEGIGLALGEKHRPAFSDGRNHKIAKAWGLNVVQMFERAAGRWAPGAERIKIGKIETSQGDIYSRKGDGPITQYMPTEKLLDHLCEYQDEGNGLTQKSLAMYMGELGISQITADSMMSRIRVHRENKFFSDIPRVEYEKVDGLYEHIVSNGKRGKDRIYVQDSAAVTVHWSPWMIEEAKQEAEITENPKTSDHLAMRLSKKWGLIHQGIRINAIDVEKRIKDGPNLFGVERVETKIVGDVWVIDTQDRDGVRQKKPVATSKMRDHVTTIYKNKINDGAECNFLLVLDVAAQATDDFGLRPLGVSIDRQWVMGQLIQSKAITSEDVETIRESGNPNSSESAMRNTIKPDSVDAMAKRDRILKGLATNHLSATYQAAVRELAQMQEPEAVEEILAMTNGRRGQHEAAMKNKDSLQALRSAPQNKWTINAWTPVDPSRVLRSAAASTKNM